MVGQIEREGGRLGLSTIRPDPKAHLNLMLSTQKLLDPSDNSIGRGSPMLGPDTVGSSGGLVVWESDELNPLEDLFSPRQKSQITVKNLVSSNSNSAYLRRS